MSTDWKIYKPNSKVSLIVIKESLRQITNLVCEDVKTVQLICQDNKIAKDIINNNKLQVKKIGLKYSLISNQELNELCTLDEKLYNFFWIGNVNFHSQSENIKFHFEYNLKLKKIELVINLPYHNKDESIKQAIKFIEYLNNPLDLHFRNEEEIRKDVTNFLQLNIDNKYYDNEWIFKHSHYTFKASGASKQIFENNEIETFRLTGFRIQFPEIFIKMTGIKVYSQNILKALLKYYNEETLELFMYGENNQTIELLEKYNPIKTENRIELEIDNNTMDHFIKNPEIYFNGILNDFQFSRIKFKPQDQNYFTIKLYGDNINEMELEVEIDKNANEEYIKRVLEFFPFDLKYAYEE